MTSARIGTHVPSIFTCGSPPTIDAPRVPLAVPGKEDGVAMVVRERAQVMEDAPARRHAAGGDDHGGHPHLVERARLDGRVHDARRVDIAAHASRESRCCARYRQ